MIQITSQELGTNGWNDKFLNFDTIEVKTSKSGYRGFEKYISNVNKYQLSHELEPSGFRTFCLALKWLYTILLTFINKEIWNLQNFYVSNDEEIKNIEFVNREGKYYVIFSRAK